MEFLIAEEARSEIDEAAHEGEDLVHLTASIANVCKAPQVEKAGGSLSPRSEMFFPRSIPCVQFRTGTTDT